MAEDTREIYLDHNATTPLDPRVLRAMLATWDRGAANPHSSSHKAGWRAAQALESARAQVAAFLGARPEQVIFTSGATEANNIAIFGRAAAIEEAEGPGHMLLAAIEHPSVREPMTALRHRGWRCEELRVTHDGLVLPEELAGRINAGTRLVAIMAANNETGVVQPLQDLAAICRKAGVSFLSDCAQAVGKVDLGPFSSGPDLITLSGHKIYGPMGIGALILGEGVKLKPLFHGGGQERALRPGSVPLPLAVALGVAAEVAAKEMGPERERLLRLSDRLLSALRAVRPDLRLNAPPDARLPGTLSITFTGVNAEDLLLEMPSLQLSTGAACASARQEPSPVLAALGLTAEESAGTIRIGLGRFTSDQEVERTIAEFGAALQRIA